MVGKVRTKARADELAEQGEHDADDNLRRRGGCVLRLCAAGRHEEVGQRHRQHAQQVQHHPVRVRVSIMVPPASSRFYTGEGWI